MTSDRGGVGPPAPPVYVPTPGGTIGSPIGGGGNLGGSDPNVHPQPALGDGNQFTPSTFGDRTRDLYGGGAANVAWSDPSGLASFELVKKAALPGGELFWWRMGFGDERGGLGRTFSPHFPSDFDRLASSTGDGSFYGTFCLPFLTTKQTATPTGDFGGLHWAAAFGTMFAAIGSGNDVSVWKETSATDPTLVALTGAGTAGRPGAVVTGMWPIRYGAAAEGVVIGKIGAVPIYMTDANGTLSGTAFPAGMSGTTGMIDTFYPAGTGASDRLVIAATSAGIGTQIAQAGINGTFTVTLSNVPFGTVAGGLVSRGSGVYRALWGAPKDGNLSVSPLKFGAEKEFRLFTTLQDGLSPEDVRFDLPRITTFAVYDDTIIASDGQRLLQDTGSGVYDLGIFRDIPSNSDRQNRIRGYQINGKELRVVCVSEATPSAAAGTYTQLFIMAYDPRTRTWQQKSANTTLGTSTGDQVVLGSTGGLPLSPYTGFGHLYANDSFYRQFAAPYGANPMSYRKSSSGAAGTGYEFESTATATTPLFELPGRAIMTSVLAIEGWPKWITRIVSGADLHSGGVGGTPASQTITAGDPNCFGQDRTVTANFTASLSRRSFPQMRNWNLRRPKEFYRLQVTNTITRQSGGTDPTRMNMNGLPFWIEGYAFRAADVNPASIPSRWLGTS